jgi:hypothetical protein
MNRYLGIAGAALLAATLPMAATAQEHQHEQGGGGGGHEHGGGMGGEHRGGGGGWNEQHGPIFGRHGAPDHEHSGGFGHQGFGRPDFNRGHSRGDYDRWRNRNRGDACGRMGYRWGCRSIADGPLIIFNLDNEVYCYRPTDPPIAIVCPYDWYDY